MGMHMAAMNASNSVLVLKEKEINANGPCYIRLSGRKQGFWSWLMTLLGINVTTTLEVYEDRIERSFGSLSGFINETIPIANISNMVYGYFKPILLIVFAIIAAIAGLVMLFQAPVIGIILLIVAALFVVGYLYKKTTVLLIIPNSACPVAVAFKRSAIEEQTITTEDAENIVAIINQLISQANK